VGQFVYTVGETMSLSLMSHGGTADGFAGVHISRTEDRDCSDISRQIWTSMESPSAT
jgi:hypothetical protein